MVVAKSQESLVNLQMQIKEKIASRNYIAVIHRCLTFSNIEIDPKLLILNKLIFFKLSLLIPPKHITFFFVKLIKLKNL